VKNIKTVSFVVLIISAFLLSNCSISEGVSVSSSLTDTQDILNKVFAEGEHNISIMQIGLPNDIAERVNEINKKFAQSVQQNQEWFLDYMREHGDKETLPWNEKFGISEDEYNELISSGDKMTLIESMKSTISIVREDDGKLILKSNPDLPYLSDIKIDTENNCLISDSGVFRYIKAVNASDKQAVTGPWSGGLWRLDFEELEDINNVDINKTYGNINIYVGQLEKTKQFLVYYDEQVIHEGQGYNGEEIILIND